jgi:agmatinase
MPDMPDMRAMLGASETTTFLGVDECNIDTLPKNCDVVVLGAPCATPYDWVGPYCRDAPTAIRYSSGTYAASRNHHNFDLGGPPIPEGAIVHDAGDVPWDVNASEANRNAIRAAVRNVIDVGAVPIVLGGDDSIPIPVLQAYEGRGPITLIQIDAHIDWRDEVRGERWGLSSTMRRCSEMDLVGTMIQIGRRGVGSARPDDVAAADRRGVKFFNAHDVHRYGVGPIAEVIPKGCDIFLTFDADGFDPTTMPAVIGPEPGGLSYFHGVELIDAAAQRGRIVGFDLVEFVPDNDINGLGALTAFRLTAHTIGRVLQQRAVR